MNKYKSYYQFDLGYLEIIASDDFLIEVGFVKENQPENPNYITDLTKHQLDEYFKYQRKEFEIPIKLSGTSFQIDCWKQLQQIPYGQTISYKEQAILINRPKAYRAVGLANGKNSLMIIIPCHRVVKSNHDLGGYTGGVFIKEYLLNHEKNYFKQ